jgi:hypothetical protein
MIGNIYALSKSAQVYVNALYQRAGSNTDAAFFTAACRAAAIRRSS